MKLKKLFNNIKGQFGINAIVPVVITFVVVGVVAVLGLQLLSDQQADYITGAAGCNATATTACGAEYNATADGITGIAKFPEKLPMIAGVLVLVLIIGVLIAAFRRVG